MIDRFIGNLGQKALSGMTNVNRASALINETIYWLLVGRGQRSAKG